MKKTVLSAAVAAFTLGVAASAVGPANAADVGACLITKTDTNPFLLR